MVTATEEEFLFLFQFEIQKEVKLEDITLGINVLNSNENITDAKLMNSPSKNQNEPPLNTNYESPVQKEKMQEFSPFKPSESVKLIKPICPSFETLELDIDKNFLIEKQEDFVGLLDDDIQEVDNFLSVKKYVDDQHPRIKLLQQASEKFPVCASDVGGLCCGGVCIRSDLEPLGLGMVIYFKIVKAFSIVFFLIMMFNVPLYYIYTSNHKGTTVLNYREALFLTTIGNIGS